MEDLQAYMMRLFLEYARLVADEEEDMVCLSLSLCSPGRRWLTIRTSNMIRRYMNLRKETSALLGKFVLLKETLGYFRKTKCLGRRTYKVRILQYHYSVLYASSREDGPTQI
jgi:hypothetical protein